MDGMMIRVLSTQMAAISCLK